MSATKSKSAVTDPVTRAMTTAEKAAEMESEGQGQSMSVPPDPKRPRGQTRATTDVERVEENAEADQDIDTAGTEMDEER